MRTAIDEITGLPYEVDATYEPSFIVTRGELAFSTHNSRSAAKAWITWNVPSDARDGLEILRM